MRVSFTNGRQFSVFFHKNNALSNIWRKIMVNLVQKTFGGVAHDDNNYSRQRHFSCACPNESRVIRYD